MLSLLVRLPGAFGMFGLSLGISNIGETLPDPVYALLSGLNAATVGIIALAAIHLSQKVVTDQFTRAVLFFCASAGMLYNALWFFPLLMFVSGCSTILWDSAYVRRGIIRIQRSLTRRFGINSAPEQSTRSDAPQGMNGKLLTTLRTSAENIS